MIYFQNYLLTLNSLWSNHEILPPRFLETYNFPEQYKFRPLGIHIEGYILPNRIKQRKTSKRHNAQIFEAHNDVCGTPLNHLSSDNISNWADKCVTGALARTPNEPDFRQFVRVSHSKISLLNSNSWLDHWCLVIQMGKNHAGVSHVIKGPSR